MASDGEQRWQAAIATFDHAHETSAGSGVGSRMLALRSQGISRAAIAAELGVTVKQLDVWSAELNWLSFGYPPELAELRARSEFTQPRDPSTTRVFDQIVREIYVPRLKTEGFRKNRFRWTRRNGRLEQSVDIQRSWSTGDLLQFTSNVLAVVDVDDVLDVSRVVVADRRIGEFFDGFDRWWSIQLGRLARDTPDVLDDPDTCMNEIARGLERAIAWLNETTELPDLVAAVRNLRSPHPLRLADSVLAVLEQL